MSKATKPTTLLDSAVEFLIEAFFNYNAKKPRVAMVHAVTAAELVLKERLTRIRPNLIFKDIDALDFARAQTVPLRHLPRRLLNLGIKITQDEVELVHQCANWRNQIVHHLPDFDPEEAKVQFPKLLNFIAEFMRRELGTPIENILGKTWYRTAKNILAEWKRVLEEANGRANTEGHVLVEACPDCGGEGVLSLRGTQVFCHLCGSDQYEYQECGRCRRPTVTGVGKSFCSKCLNEVAEALAGDLYISQLIDWRHFK
jgi:hypothetical protein